MGWEAWLTLGVLGVMLAALVRNIAGPDVVLLGAMVVLMTLGLFSDRLPDPAGMVAGFGNAGAVTVGVLFVVSAGLTQTGAMQMVTAPLLGRPRSARGAQGRVMLPVMGLSAFLNNTPIVAMLVPVVSDWARKIGVSPSKLLIPLSYAAIFGGMCTLIGTSTNLLIYGLMREDGLEIGLFTVGVIGLPVALAGLAYVLLFGRWLLPERKAVLDSGEDPRRYTVEMVVDPGSGLAGQSIEQAGLRSLPGLFLVELHREDQVLQAVSPETRLHAGDRLVFVGVVASVVDLRKVRGLSPATDQVFKLDTTHHQRRLIEAVVSPSCPLIGRSIREGRFRTRYNAAVIAVARDGHRIERKVGDIVLRPGDTLLVEAPRSFVIEQRNRRDFYLVSAVDDTSLPRHDKAPLALAILGLFVVAVALRWVTPLHAALLAVGLLYVTRCVTASMARHAVDWSVLLVIGAALGIGAAVRDSGLASEVAHGIIAMVGTNPLLVLAAIYLVTNLFTELITNNAAAVLVYPIAQSVAMDLGVDFMPFVVTIMIAASASFATPIGYQTNLMVYGPGGYRYTDYLRFGLPLNLLVLVVTLVVAAAVWGVGLAG